MTKYQLNRADAPWDYPSLGFRADTGTAILDGSTFDPPITIPPDVFWSVYGGGSPESGITRYTFPVVPATPSVEPMNGAILAWDAAANRYRAKSPQEFVDLLAAMGGGGSLIEHINSSTPHPAYDSSGPSFLLLYQNAKV